VLVTTTTVVCYNNVKPSPWMLMLEVAETIHGVAAVNTYESSEGAQVYPLK